MVDSLNEPAPGVLSNDSDPDIGDTLSVYSVNGSTSNVGADTATVDGGTIHLNADGSFQYVANPADSLFGGSDSFTYVAEDNHGLTSNEVTVDMEIIGECEVGTGPISVSGMFGAQGTCVCESGAGPMPISGMFGEQGLC